MDIPATEVFGSYGRLLYIRKDGNTGASHPINQQTCTIGRHDDCDIRIRMLEVSRIHAKIEFNEEGKATLLPMSVTLVNGIEIKDPIVLTENDQISIHERTFQFQYAEKPGPAINLPSVESKTPKKASTRIGTAETPKSATPSTPRSSRRNSIGLSSVKKLSATPMTIKSPLVNVVAVAAEPDFFEEVNEEQEIQQQEEEKNNFPETIEVDSGNIESVADEFLHLQHEVPSVSQETLENTDEPTMDFAAPLISFSPLASKASTPKRRTPSRKSTPKTISQSAVKTTVIEEAQPVPALDLIQLNTPSKQTSEQDVKSTSNAPSYMQPTVSNSAKKVESNTNLEVTLPEKKTSRPNSPLRLSPLMKRKPADSTPSRIQGSTRKKSKLQNEIFNASKEAIMKELDFIVEEQTSYVKPEEEEMTLQAKASLPGTPAALSIQKSQMSAEAGNPFDTNSPALPIQQPEQNRSSEEPIEDSNIQSDNSANSTQQKRNVTFGPPLSPEIFDKHQPAMTPVRRGKRAAMRQSLPGVLPRSILRSGNKAHRQSDVHDLKKFTETENSGSEKSSLPFLSAIKAAAAAETLTSIPSSPSERKQDITQKESIGVDESAETISEQVSQENVLVEESGNEDIVVTDAEEKEIQLEEQNDSVQDVDVTIVSEIASADAADEEVPDSEAEEMEVPETLKSEEQYAPDAIEDAESSISEVQEEQVTSNEVAEESVLSIETEENSIEVLETHVVDNSFVEEEDKETEQESIEEVAWITQEEKQGHESIAENQIQEELKPQETSPILNENPDNEDGEEEVVLEGNSFIERPQLKTLQEEIADVIAQAQNEDNMVVEEGENDEKMPPAEEGVEVQTLQNEIFDNKEKLSAEPAESAGQSSMTTPLKNLSFVFKSQSVPNKNKLLNRNSQNSIATANALRIRPVSFYGKNSPVQEDNVSQTSSLVTPSKKAVSVKNTPGTKFVRASAIKIAVEKTPLSAKRLARSTPLSLRKSDEVATVPTSLLSAKETPTQKKSEKIKTPGTARSFVAVPSMVVPTPVQPSVDVTKTPKSIRRGSVVPSTPLVESSQSKTPKSTIKFTPAQQRSEQPALSKTPATSKSMRSIISVLEPSTDKNSTPITVKKVDQKTPSSIQSVKSVVSSKPQTPKSALKSTATYNRSSPLVQQHANEKEAAPVIEEESTGIVSRQQTPVKFAKSKGSAKPSPAPSTPIVHSVKSVKSVRTSSRAGVPMTPLRQVVSAKDMEEVQKEEQEIVIDDAVNKQNSMLDNVENEAPVLSPIAQQQDMEKYVTENQVEEVEQVELDDNSDENKENVEKNQEVAQPQEEIEILEQNVEETSPQGQEEKGTEEANIVENKITANDEAMIEKPRPTRQAGRPKKGAAVAIVEEPVVQENPNSVPVRTRRTRKPSVEITVQQEARVENVVIPEEKIVEEPIIEEKPKRGARSKKAGIVPVVEEVVEPVVPAVVEEEKTSKPTRSSRRGRGELIEETAEEDKQVAIETSVEETVAGAVVEKDKHQKEKENVVQKTTARGGRRGREKATVAVVEVQIEEESSAQHNDENTEPSPENEEIRKTTRRRGRQPKKPVVEENIEKETPVQQDENTEPTPVHEEIRKPTRRGRQPKQQAVEEKEQEQTLEGHVVDENEVPESAKTKTTSSKRSTRSKVAAVTVDVEETKEKVEPPATTVKKRSTRKVLGEVIEQETVSTSLTATNTKTSTRKRKDNSQHEVQQEESVVEKSVKKKRNAMTSKEIVEPVVVSAGRATRSSARRG